MTFTEMVDRATEIVNSEEIDVAELSTIIVDMDAMHSTVLAERDNAVDNYTREVEKNVKLQDTNHEFMKRLTDKAVDGGSDSETEEDEELTFEEVEELVEENIEEIAKEWMGE